MRNLKTALAVAVLALAVALVPAAAAKPGKGKGKGPKEVTSTVTVTGSPSTVTAATGYVTAVGNVKANSSCRKDRTVRFIYSSGTGGMTPLAVTVETGSNGDFAALLPRPADAPPAAVTLLADVDQVTRKVGSKKKGKKRKKGRKFECLSGQGQAAIAVVP
ncbi:MAG: hypothetical protein ACRDKH_00255 [Solirubrobacterales bacterium]